MRSMLLLFAFVTINGECTVMLTYDGLDFLLVIHPFVFPFYFFI